MALNVDGRHIPAKPLQPDFENADYIRSYMVLYASTGKMHENEGNTISRDEYANGYDPGKGNLRVEIHFDEALAGTINVVLYAEFDNVIEIGRNRQVLFDYIA